MLFILGVTYGIFSQVTRSLLWLVFHHFSSKLASCWILIWCLLEEPCRP